MSTNIGIRSEPVGDEVREYLFILTANTLEISDYYMKNFRALPLHPIDGAGVTHLSITATQKAPLREPLRLSRNLIGRVGRIGRIGGVGGRTNRGTPE